MFESIEDILRILHKIILEVLFLHFVVGLSHAADEFGRQSLVLGLQPILLHLLEPLLCLIILLLQTLVILLHVHLSFKVLLQCIKLNDIVDFYVPRGEIEHVEDRDVVGV